MLRITTICILVSHVLSQAATAEPPTVSQVKQAFEKAILSSGWKVGDTTNAVIEREAPRIAQAIEDMKDVRVFAEKSNGVEHGFCYAVYPNDQIQRMGYHQNGKRTGPWQFFFPDGTLATKIQYDPEGKEIGQRVTYLRNGNVHFVETYAAGLKHGPKTTFYEDGNTYMHQRWKNGMMDGLSIIYYPDGVVKKYASWSNGRQHGSVVLYDEDGNVVERGQYLNGQKQ